MGKHQKMGSFECRQSITQQTKLYLCILAIKSAKCKRKEQQTFGCKNGAKDGINFVQMIEVKKGKRRKALSNSAAFSHMIIDYVCEIKSFKSTKKLLLYFVHRQRWE